ncbi:exosporium glycoprotein BclB-related protein [Sporosarcina sp. JAI121]|uniref:exosporium glycoprotein BclB-related protein n=1 Tax=Sporosarcina sp. JAI121 TaxID=2723064 RepID=UPI0015C6D654|nr:exosporium glycoprotein BclB-related protein [Sporosarcina sp. JAI121]NYF26361.1 BclB C-terminal domain-containing protein [Sporosarcina sp. JAI121]
MSYNNSRKHGCGGCGGFNHGGSACNRIDTGEVRCNFGPFTAIDAACINPRANTGSIIPFASGLVPVALTSLAGGLVGIPFFIGFGTAIPSPVVLGATINLTGLINEAFSVPRTGSVTAISASYTLTAALSVPAETATVTAQIYRAPAGSNVFTPTAARVDLAPPLTGLLTIGTTLFGASSSFAPVSVSVGDRLLMVYSISGTTLATTAIGTASAGITIE